MSTRSGTVDKALDVLAHLHAAGVPLGISDIGRDLGLPKASVHRWLASLGRRGYVEQGEDGRYRLGFALVRLGLATLDREPLLEAARPVLEKEARTLGETLFLAAARLGRIVVLDKVEGTGLLRVAPRVGDSAPVHATAVGKLFLALAPDLVTAPREPLECFTPRTIRDRGALESAVETVRRRGWSESREEWIPGLAFVAAPVRIGSRLVAAVAAAVPTARFGRKEHQTLVEVAIRAARRVSARLEGASP